MATPSILSVLSHAKNDHINIEGQLVPLAKLTFDLDSDNKLVLVEKKVTKFYQIHEKFTLPWNKKEENLKKATKIETILGEINTLLGEEIERRRSNLHQTYTKDLTNKNAQATQNIVKNVKEITGKLRSEANKLNNHKKQIVISFAPSDETSSPHQNSSPGINKFVEGANKHCIDINSHLRAFDEAGSRQRLDVTPSFFKKLTPEEKIEVEIRKIEKKIPELESFKKRLPKTDSRRDVIEHKLKVLNYAKEQILLPKPTYAKDIDTIFEKLPAGNMGLSVSLGKGENNKKIFSVQTNLNKINILRIVINDTGLSPKNRQLIEELYIAYEANEIISNAISNGFGVDDLADQIIDEDITALCRPLQRAPTRIEKICGAVLSIPMIPLKHVYSNKVSYLTALASIQLAGSVFPSLGVYLPSTETVGSVISDVPWKEVVVVSGLAFGYRWLFSPAPDAATDTPGSAPASISDQLNALNLK